MWVSFTEPNYLNSDLTDFDPASLPRPHQGVMCALQYGSSAAFRRLLNPPLVLSNGVD